MYVFQISLVLGELPLAPLYFVTSMYHAPQDPAHSSRSFDRDEWSQLGSSYACARASCVTKGANALALCNYAKLKIDAAEGSIETPLVVYTPRDLR